MSQKLQEKLEQLQVILDLNWFYQSLQLALEKAQENFSGICSENNSRVINININYDFLNQGLVINVELI